MRHHGTTSILSISILVICALIVAAGEALAQSPAERPDLFTKVQDTAWIFLLRGKNDTLDPNLASGSYEFNMQHDSTCLSSYLFTEPWHNGELLKLLHWELGRSVNIHEDLLSLNSRTEDFTVRAGDTVSFMRYFRWFTDRAPHQENFISRDTLIYVVELVGAHDSARHQKRLAVIDSFGVMPRATPGAPRFFGGSGRDISRVVRYAVPASIDGKRAFMRIRLHAGGSGAYYFTRTDDVTVDMSGLLLDPEISGYIAAVSAERFWKPLVRPEEEMVVKAGNVMSIERRESGDPRLTVRLAPAPELGNVSVVIYNANGAAIATLFSGVVESMQTLGYDLPASGTYFIAISDGNRTLHTETIILTK